MVVQQFMLDYPREVNAAFVSKYGDGKTLSSAQRMNVRHDLAKAMLYSRYSHLVNELENKAKDQHKLDMNTWNMILEDISLAGDVGKFVFYLLLSDFVDLRPISRARDSLFDAVYPLLQAIGSYAGCYVSLIAGNPGGGDDDKGFFTA